jgi:hypothetical protein
MTLKEKIKDSVIKIIEIVKIMRSFMKTMLILS